MPPPGIRSPNRAKKRKVSRPHKLKPKVPSEVGEVGDVGDEGEIGADNTSQLPVPATSFHLNQLPTELQHMIWSEVLKRPSCHHFKLRKGDDGSNPNHWVIHLSEKRPMYDPSTYRHWKELHKLKNVSFGTAFRRCTTQIQPITLRSSKPPLYRATAAIDVPTDLIILDFDRGSTSTPFTWFEHATLGPFGTMNIRTVRSRLQHFRKVAIHWNDKQAPAAHGGPFQCYCAPGPAAFCSQLKACPLELACFLDCFQNLEEFYLVVDVRLKKQRVFAADYKDLVVKQDFQGLCQTKEGNRDVTLNFNLAHFFDTKTEFIQQAPPGFMPPRLEAQCPFMGTNSARDCVGKTSRYFHSKEGNEPFLTRLQQRQQVKFGVLIPYALEQKKPAI